MEKAICRRQENMVFENFALRRNADKINVSKPGITASTIQAVEDDAELLVIRVPKLSIGNLDCMENIYLMRKETSHLGNQLQVMCRVLWM